MAAYNLYIENATVDPFNFDDWVALISNLPSNDSKVSKVTDEFLIDFVQKQGPDVWESADGKLQVVYSGLHIGDPSKYAKYVVLTVDASVIAEVVANPMYFVTPPVDADFGVDSKFWI
jgi:hypothetical protein